MDSARLTPSQSSDAKEISRSNPTAARVLRQWRMLTGGSQVKDSERQTLVAVSGGADSTALAAILALVNPKPVIAHIIHDLREPEIAMSDRDSAKFLAEHLGCPFYEESIVVASQSGNVESNARDARYERLRKIALELGVQYIATGHHADDQLETMLMNLMRGAGPRGLGGIHESRVSDGITIIRPMLHVTHQDALDLCNQACLGFVHDHSNDDEAMTRNRIRHQLLPILRALQPDIALRASKSAIASRSCVEALESFVREHVWSLGQFSEYSVLFDRSSLSDQPSGVIVEIIKLAIERLAEQGVLGLDQVTQQSMNDAIRAMKDKSTERRLCRVGPIVIEVHASKVLIFRATRPNEE